MHWLYSPNIKGDCLKTDFKSYFPFLYFHSVTLNASLRPPMPPPTITQQLHTELPRTDFHLNSINFENFMQKLNLKISPPDLHRGDGLCCSFFCCFGPNCRAKVKHKFLTLLQPTELSKDIIIIMRMIITVLLLKDTTCKIAKCY